MNRPSDGGGGEHPTDTTKAKGRAAYGFDGGFLMPLAAVFAVAIIVFAVATRSPPRLVGGGVAFLFLGTGLHSSRRGKFLVWEEVVDGLHLRGDERVLDLGCGRGAVLLSVAKRLTSGRGFGVDIWSRIDQSGNSVDAFRRNADAEGVAARVEPLTADMMALPFPADAFDVIVSSIAIHNIRGRRGREKAIDEAVRVLRPGGRLLVADLSYTGSHAKRLVELGMADVGRRSLGWRMWWGGPWKATHLVTARKPEGGSRRAA
jgi:ubiquinone/menaquinone biosynthesis C-methylase UbiE